MDETKRMLLAVVLSIAVMWAYATFFAPQPENQAPRSQPAGGQKTVSAKPKAKAVRPAASQAGALPPTPAGPVRQVVVDTPLYTATFSEAGATLQKVVLKRYYNQPEKQGGPFVMLDLKGHRPYSLALELGKGTEKLASLHFRAERERLELSAGKGKKSLSFTARLGGLEVIKTYTFDPATYAFHLKVTVINRGAEVRPVTPGITLTEDPAKGKINTYAFTGVLYYKDGKLKEIAHDDLGEDKPDSGSIAWMAMSIPYFMGAVAPEDLPPTTKLTVTGAKLNGYMAGTLLGPTRDLPPGAQTSFTYLVYYGPRDLDILEGVGHHLAAAVDFGWFDFIAKPMLAALKFLYRYVGNYGLAIIIITILVKFLFWPLTARSYKSMKKMQKLAPQVQRIRKKYKDDKQRMNQEVMQLYKTYKVNPMGGCLPMLVQIPVFIAFYKVLGISIELRHAPFMLWINDLSAPDRLWPDLGIPWVGGIPVLTLLMGVSMFIQQKMTPTTGDPTQAKMMMLMPVVFTFLFINFPSGLVLYWLVNNLLSIGQQYLTNKRKD